MRKVNVKMYYMLLKCIIVIMGYYGYTLFSSVLTVVTQGSTGNKVTTVRFRFRVRI